MHQSLKLWVSKSSWRSMHEDADGSYPLETGGILAGYWAESGEAVVQCVSGPGPNADKKTDHFSPDYDYQERWIAELYALSGGDYTYLGDWHSHPGDRAGSLSRLDVSVAQKIASFEPARVHSPLMMLLFGTAESWSVKCWAGRRRWLCFRSMKMVELDIQLF